MEEKQCCPLTKSPLSLTRFGNNIRVIGFLAEISVLADDPKILAPDILLTPSLELYQIPKSFYVIQMNLPVLAISVISFKRD